MNGGHGFGNRAARLWRMLVCLGSLGAAATLAAANALEILTATVPDVLPGGKPIELRIECREGRPVAGIATAPAYNRSPVEVEVGGLTIETDKLDGELRYRVASDGYQPAAEGAVRVDSLRVTRVPAPDPDSLVRLVLDAENLVQTEDRRASPRSRRMQVTFSIRDGRAFGGKAVPPGSLTDVGCAPHVTRLAVALREGRLSGTLGLRVQPQDSARPAEDYDYEIEGRVIGDLATGRMIRLRDGKPVGPDGPFVGRVRRGPAPTAGEALYKLTIRDALGPGKFIDVYLAASGGRLRHGFATSPNFNNATHPVEVSGLRLEGSTITGNLGVVVQPDPWIPADGRPIECSFPVQATITDGEIEGKAGAFVVEGSLTDKPSAAPAKQVTLKLENALHGTGGWKSRAFVSCELDGGRVIGGRVTNNHTWLEGKVTGGGLTLADDRLTGSVTAEVIRGAGAAEGRYTFDVEVQMVGSVGAGTFVSRSGEAEKRGRLWVATTSKAE